MCHRSRQQNLLVFIIFEIICSLWLSYQQHYQTCRNTKRQQKTDSCNNTKDRWWNYDERPVWSDLEWWVDDDHLVNYDHMWSKTDNGYVLENGLQAPCDLEQWLGQFRSVSQPAPFSVSMKTAFVVTIISGWCSKPLNKVTVCLNLCLFVVFNWGLLEGDGLFLLSGEPIISSLKPHTSIMCKNKVLVQRSVLRIYTVNFKTKLYCRPLSFYNHNWCRNSDNKPNDMCFINEVMTWGSIITSETKQCYYVIWISQINKNTEMAQQQT